MMKCCPKLQPYPNLQLNSTTIISTSSYESQVVAYNVKVMTCERIIGLQTQ